MPRAYIGLGSNLNNPLVQLRAALVTLANIPAIDVSCVSSFYSSSPMGPQDQPDFVNAVAEISTALSAHQLLAELLRIEKDAGRDRAKAVHWGPRILDLDLLVYADEIIHDSKLTVPHPGIAGRNFVLLPLQEIAPDLMIPGADTVRNLAQVIGSEGLRRLVAAE